MLLNGNFLMRSDNFRRSARKPGPSGTPHLRPLTAMAGQAPFWNSCCRRVRSVTKERLTGSLISENTATTIIGENHEPPLSALLCYTSGYLFSPSLFGQFFECVLPHVSRLHQTTQSPVVPTLSPLRFPRLHNLSLPRPRCLREPYRSYLSQPSVTSSM